MNAIEILDIFTQRRVSVNITNNKCSGGDFSPEYKVAISKDGKELASFIGGSFELQMNNAYQWAIDNKVINNAPVYLEQCHNCVFRVAGQVLEICKDPDSIDRHRNWHYTQNHDHCLCKRWLSEYPTEQLRAHLTPEQFKVAQTIIEEDKRATTQRKGAKQA